MKKVAISQSNYIPWRGYFDLISSVDEFVIFDENGIVHLRMLGACVSCPSSTVTVRFMIKNMLQYYFDEVNDVKHVDWDEEEGKD